MQGDLFINGKDAYTEWGISLDETALSVLMTPVGIKPPVENKGRGADGKQVLGLGQASYSPRLDEREFSLIIHLTAPTESVFIARYASFCKVLEGGRLDIRTRWERDKVYHCIYLSCSQFFQQNRTLASYTLRLNEPNPRNRT